MLSKIQCLLFHACEEEGQMYLCGRLLLPVISSIICAACAPPVGVLPPDSYNPASDARIRVYSVPDHYIWLFPDQTCAQVVSANYRGKKFLGVSTGVDQLLRTVHIGMPEPDNEHDARYNEFVVKAGEPLTLMAKYIELVVADPLMPYVINGGKPCGPRVATLLPKAGHDYEAFSNTYWPTHGMNDCLVHLREIKHVKGRFIAVRAESKDGAFTCGGSP